MEEKKDCFTFLKYQKKNRKIEDVLKEGDKFLVKVLDIDNQGKISLTKKD